jgi:hypothetical protein
MTSTHLETGVKDPRVERLVEILAELANTQDVIRQLCAEATCDPERAALLATAAGGLAQLSGLQADEAIEICGGARTSSVQEWVLPPRAR